jgi:hypothetical protein
MRSEEDLKSEFDGLGGWNPKDEAGEPSALRFTLDFWLSTTAFTGPAPPVSWLIKDVMPVGVWGLVAAAGDVGKSMLLLFLSLLVVSPRRPLDPYVLGGEVIARGAVVFLTAEDSKGSVHRRLENLDPNGERRHAPGAFPLYVIPLPDAGGPIALIAQGREGLILTPQYHALKAMLKRVPSLALVVIDPMQAFVLADVNADPMAGQFLSSALAALAADTGATVLVTHHVRKGNGNPGTSDELRETIRGTTALVDGPRAVVGLAPAADRDAKAILKHLGRPWEPRAVVRCAVVKSNEPANRSMHTLLRNANGLLMDVSDRLTGLNGWTKVQMDALVESVAEGAREGRPFTKRGRSGLYERRAELCGDLQAIGRNSLEEMAEELLVRRHIVQALATGTTVQWLDVPDGPFATGAGEFAPGAKRGKSGPRGSGSPR